MADEALPQRRCEIYAWVCPTTGTLVYVGKTSAGIGVRMASHRTTALRKAKNASHLWLKDRLDAGLTVEAVHLATCSVAESSRVERDWIAKLGGVSALLNERVGGNGNPGVGRVKWTPEAIGLLGKIHDGELAARLGCERGTVSYRRRALGIKPRKQSLPASTITLPLDITARLGTCPDYLLAMELGVSKFVIAKHRRRLAIPSHAETSGANGHFQRTDRGVRRKPLSREVEARLGTVPDCTIAMELGYRSAS
jgi:hypothetical protein